MFNLFFGVLRDNPGIVSRTAQSLPRKSMSTNDIAMAECLIAISDRSTEKFQLAMLEVVESVRKIRTSDPHYKLIDLRAHGLWELAFRTSPNIVEHWDVDRGLPWDTDLWSWLRKGTSAIDTIDDSSFSAAAKALLKMPSSLRIGM